MDGLMVMGVVASLVGGGVWMFVRRRFVRRTGARVDTGAAAPVSAAGVPTQGLACPSCHREFAEGVRFCSADGRTLVSIEELAGTEPASSIACKSCQRSFDSSTRFCPFDGDELPPPAGATRAALVPETRAMTVVGPAKICPSCNQRYLSDDAFCARDAAALVVVH